jgi:hypothetical protein
MGSAMRTHEVSNDRRYDQIPKGQGNHPPPTHVHQLIIAITRESCATPDESVKESEDFCAKPE